MVSASGLALPAAAQVGDALAEDMDEIFVGGIELPPHFEQVDDAKQTTEDKNLQLIPVVEEDEPDDSGKSTQSKK